MFGFKEVCFVAGGVDFKLRYVIHTFSMSFLPHSVQGTEQKRNHIE